MKLLSLILIIGLTGCAKKDRSDAPEHLCLERIKGMLVALVPCPEETEIAQ